MDTIPSLKPLRTTKNEKTCNRFNKPGEADHDDQPLSPMARLFHEPGSNVYVIGILGSKTKLRSDVIIENLLQAYRKNHRFFSLQVVDKEDGSMKWIPTQVNMDDHVIIAKLDPNNMDSPAKFVEDYISNLSKSPIDFTKPLWDFHILDVKTSEQVQGTCVFRYHHSLGDGISVMNLVLACTRKVSDPEALPTLPGNYNKSSSSSKVVISLWSRLEVLWNSFVALLLFMLTTWFLEDTKTPMRGSKGAEHRPRRFVVRSVSIDDIKLVKKAMNNVTFNDVVLGVTQAGLYRYLHRRYSEIDNKKVVDIPNKMRFRATFLFNLRATTRIDEISDDTNTSHGTWGNKIGYVLLPFNIGFKKDPLDYVREAKAAMKRKKASLEPLFTHLLVTLVVNLFGIKTAGKLNHKVFSNTTLGFSNVPGPQEEISFCGHNIEYLASTCYGQPIGLMIHVISYMDKVTFTISVDEEAIPDPHKLCDDLEESLHSIKASAKTLNLVK